MSTAAERLKAKAKQTLERENTGTIQEEPTLLSSPPPSVEAPTRTTRLGKQVVVELPITTANRLRRAAFEADTTQALVIQALVEAWLSNEVHVDLTRPVRPVRTRKGQPHQI